jgi:hypothetical protein
VSNITGFEIVKVQHRPINYVIQEVAGTKTLTRIINLSFSEKKKNTHTHGMNGGEGFRNSTTNRRELQHLQLQPVQKIQRQYIRRDGQSIYTKSFLRPASIAPQHSATLLEILSLT